MPGRIFYNCGEKPCDTCDGEIDGYTKVGDFSITSMTCHGFTCPGPVGGRVTGWYNGSPYGQVMVAAGTYEGGVGMSTYLFKYAYGYNLLWNSTTGYTAAYRTTGGQCCIDGCGTTYPATGGFWIRRITVGTTVDWEDVWQKQCGDLIFEHRNDSDLYLLNQQIRPGDGCDTGYEIHPGSSDATYGDGEDWTGCLFRDDAS